jgi:hypothetical protein
MGLRDTAEQLEACRAQSVLDEQTIEQQSARIRELQLAYDLQRQRADEAEHELVQAESALGERLRHDSHGTAAVEADLLSARARLAAVGYLVHPLTDGEPLTAGAIRRILDEVTAEPWGAFLDLEQAALVARACRHSAASIRAVLDVDPDRLHPDVAPYVGRLEELADRLQATR